MKQIVKILVVEDEYITAKILSNFLEASGYVVVGCAMDVDEALHYLQAKEVDCVVLDINLNDSKDGIWIANTIKKKYNIPFLFLTAYTDKKTITRAISSSPYGFLAKPFQEIELFTAIEIALLKHNELSNSNSTSEDLNAKTFFLKHIDRYDKVLVEDIHSIETQKNYLLIQTEKITYKHRATLKEFYSHLPKSVFIKTHRSFLVNKSKILSIDKINNSCRVLNKSIPISEAYKQEFLLQLI